jgi:energy-coupling factor transporter ATP-binding protein EcfA2
VKSTAKKTECADEHTEQSGDAVIEEKDLPETPEEQTITFQAIRPGDDDPRAAGRDATAAPGQEPDAEIPTDVPTATPEPPSAETGDTAERDAARTGAAGTDGTDSSGGQSSDAAPGQAAFNVFAPVKAGAAQVATGDTGTSDAVSGKAAFDAFAPVKAQAPEVATEDTAASSQAHHVAVPKDESPANDPSPEARDTSSTPENASAVKKDDSPKTRDVSPATPDVSTVLEDVPDPQGVSPAPEDVSADHEDVSPVSGDVSAEKLDVSPVSEDVPADPRDVSSVTKDVSADHEDVSADHEDVSPVSGDVSAEKLDFAPVSEDVPAADQDVSLSSEDVSTDTPDVSPVPEDVAADDQDVLPVSEDVSFDPFKETKSRTSAGQPQSGPGDTGSRDVWEPAEAAPAADADGSDDSEGGSIPPYQRVREVPLPKPVSRALTAALSGLRDSVTGLRLGLDVPGVEEARKAQTEILAQIEDYVIPRVHMSTAPALVVVAGSTGAGKSTLVNTLAAAKVSSTGVRRPTTGTPVLACHPDDRDWFAKGDVLNGMIRVDRPGPDGTLDSLVLASTERLPQGVALLDTPDIDSVVETHHEIAHRMLDAADLWVFVTTAARYADAPAWNLLRLAKERGARLAIVLSRVPVRSREVIDKHFSRMLQEYGLGDVERFVINESTVTGGRLPEEEVAELRMWLTELSVDEQRRGQAVQATLDGVLNSFRSRIPALARHLEAQVAFRAELRTDVDAAYMGALAEIDEATSDGSLLRGEVLARWQDFAGSGDLMKTLHLRRPGRLATKSSQQAPMRLRAFKSALRSGLESVIVSAGQRAAVEVVARWRQRDGVGDRLAAVSGLGRPSDEFVRRVGRTIGAWQEHVVALIRSGGVTKRSVAKLVSFDEEALALVFMISLLGYGSSDVATSSGTGTLPERMLRGVLGADSLRTIGTKARSDLRARISLLFDEETLRYVQVLDEAGIPDEAAAKRLYQATYNLEVAR